MKDCQGFDWWAKYSPYYTHFHVTATSRWELFHHGYRERIRDGTVPSKRLPKTLPNHLGSVEWNQAAQHDDRSRQAHDMRKIEKNNHQAYQRKRDWTKCSPTRFNQGVKCGVLSHTACLLYIILGRDGGLYQVTWGVIGASIEEWRYRGPQ